MITWENYEEYMMMHADGELKPAEELALMAFVHEHPELKKELEIYSMIKLQPDTAIVYEDKKNLARKDEKKKVIAFPRWQWYSIAAGLALVLFVSILKYKASDDGMRYLVADNAGTQQQATPVDTVLPQQQQTATITDTVITEQNTHTASADDDDNETPVNTPVYQKAVDDKQTKPQNTAAVAQWSRNNDAIIKISPTDVRELPRNSIAAAVPVATTIPILEQAVDNSGPQKKTLLSKLPIDDRKKQNIANVATALADGVDKLNEIKQDLEDRSITIKVERRRLVLSF